MAGIDRRGHAFGGRHQRPRLIRGVVQKKVVPNAGESAQLRAALAAGKGLKAKPVRQLMGDHGNEVDLTAMVIVQPEVEGSSSKTTGLAQVDVEIGGDVDVGGIDVRTRELIDQGLRVPMATDWSPREVPEDLGRTGAAKNRGVRGASQTRSESGDPDRHAACESRP